MADGYCAGNTPFTGQTIRTIGAALRATYESELSDPIPRRLFALLINLDKHSDGKEARGDSPRE